MSTAYVEKNHEGYSQEQSKKAIKGIIIVLVFFFQFLHN